ncbi:MAG: preprotein translocase subunit YajC [Acidobacteria bacterium]|nr:MAG: preprotein translocase subunit YajC [Acidobacteriota bacterium]REK12110.1 MAG: preprotein translocase subunit YajC [Acidobacteriota bacterium]
MHALRLTDAAAGVLAQAAAPPPAWVQFAPLVFILLIFYFIAIRPARKKQLELQKTIEGLQKGDKVITTGGLYAEVVSSDKVSVVVKISDGVKVRVAKSAIAGLQNQESGA